MVATNKFKTAYKKERDMKKMVFLLWLGLLGTCFHEVNAQKLRLLDENGMPVPYVAWLDSVNQHYLLSDSKGMLALEGEKISDSTVFCLVSDFYERQCMRWDDMKKAGTVVVKNKVQQLPGFSVLPPASAEDLLKKAAGFFSTHYAKDYIAPMTYYRILGAGTQCTRLYAVQMLWASFSFTTKPPKFCWDDKNLMGRALPLDAYVSYSYLPGSEEQNTLHQVHNAQLKGMDAYLMNYSESLNWGVLVQKRSLELYSPLNAKQIGNFDYSVGMMEDASGEKVYVVTFTTKAVAFPAKTKLYGKGRIYMKESGFPFRVEMENVEDRYMGYVRAVDSCRVLLSPYDYAVEYKMQDGHIYTASVSRHVRWERPENLQEGVGLYTVESNTYRQPFKNRLSSSVEISFGEPVFLGKKERSMYEVYFPEDAMGDVLYYVDSVDLGFWHRKLRSMPDFPTLESDLERCGLSLDEQALEMNATYPGTWSAQHVKSYERQQRSRMARELYLYLYGKEYTE